MFDSTPSEVTIADIYLPPALFVAMFGLMAAWVAAKLLNRTGLSRFFWHPPLAFLAMWALASALIGLLFLRP